MNHIKVKIPANPTKTYPILINSGFLKNINVWFPRNYSRFVIITDNTVKKYYASAFAQQLKKIGHKILLLSFPAGEKSKNIKTHSVLIDQLIRNQFGRDSIILAIGGGVVGDMAGFVAATFMRGIPYIQIPTTLLAMVDSSVGGKTGIDTAHGKNLIGAFWQPHSVIADLDCLSTLPKKHLINGLIEAVKIFLIHNAKSFFYTKKNICHILKGDSESLLQLIFQAVKIKSVVVQKDEKELHLRQILNFGHTIGHALEQLSSYKILHGYAVAYGILVEAKISELLGYLDRDNFLLIQTLFNDLGIKIKELKKWDINKIIEQTKNDKKSRAGKVNYVLLSKIGKVYKKNSIYVHPVSDSLVKKAYLKLIEE